MLLSQEYFVAFFKKTDDLPIKHFFDKISQTILGENLETDKVIEGRKIMASN